MHICEFEKKDNKKISLSSSWMLDRIGLELRDGCNNGKMK